MKKGFVFTVDVVLAFLLFSSVFVYLTYFTDLRKTAPAKYNLVVQMDNILYTLDDLDMLKVGNRYEIKNFINLYYPYKWWIRIYRLNGIEEILVEEYGNVSDWNYFNDEYVSGKYTFIDINGSDMNFYVLKYRAWWQ